MRWIIAPFTIALVVAFSSYQSGVTPVLQASIQKLQAAKELQVSYTVQVVGGAAEDYTIHFAKPDEFVIETPTGFIQSDGKLIHTYTKKSNTYTETVATPEAVAAIWAKPEVWGWAGFFDAKYADKIATSKADEAKSIKGMTLTPVNASGENLPAITFYIDASTSTIQGYLRKDKDSSTIVMASKVETSDTAPDATMFAFVAPADSKKVEEMAMVSFDAVQSLLSTSCMPCHSADRHSGQVNLSSYEGVMKTVTPGDVENSLIIKSLRGTGGVEPMPYKRTPLSDDKIKIVEGWIKAGAKK